MSNITIFMITIIINVKITPGMHSSYLRTHKTMYYMTMFDVSIFTFDEIGKKAAILDFFIFMITIMF